MEAHPKGITKDSGSFKHHFSSDQWQS